MLRVAAILLLALVPLAGGFEAREAPLESASVPAPLPVPVPMPVPAQPCAPVLEAEARGHYVALAWSGCDAASYQVLRGASPDALAPLVEVKHAGHNDVAPLPVGYYAVRTPAGGLSAPVVVAMG